MKNKIKALIKEYWSICIPICIIIGVSLCLYYGITKESTLTAGDIVILVIVHAFLSKNDHKCNCKEK